ncbi:MAG TPA: ATP phosphoribosyltransferase regulatory subunit [Phycisphaerales bacterium]|nr:ATP phosphoribosyltransferase regulatory subunit [Phycisphaerales bacterium]
MSDPRPKPNEPIQGPRGTRDLYPAEAVRRRWITERWREVAVRHGFEEVDGPTFEESDLYAVKSGEGILGELFQAYSGKSPEEVEQVKRTGRAPYAMRPEFTPTLARMYAARAAGLPKPCKWFQIGPFFRAERPQRGRLREFLQWNCDVIGLDVPVEKWNAEDAESRAEVAEAKARMDAECIACCVEFLRACGLTADDCKVRFGDRAFLDSCAVRAGVTPEQYEVLRWAVDSLNKVDDAKRQAEFDRVGMTSEAVAAFFDYHKSLNILSSTSVPLQDKVDATGVDHRLVRRSADFMLLLDDYGLHGWWEFDSGVVRGLAYYTGTVFEVIAEGERAVAGGGRYDNLIELFGGPPTPAVGFAMGDVVLANLLQDKGLMPSDAELMGLVGQTPDVFVLSNGAEEAERQVRPLVASLRRGSRAPQDSGLRTQDSLHVRHSYKATKNVGKLLKEAAQQGARFAVIVESATEATVKNLRTGEQWPDRVPIGEVGRRIAERLRGG